MPNKPIRIIKNCHFCANRHGCRYDFDKMFEVRHGYMFKSECKHWRIGGCLFCKHLTDTEENWFHRGCETWCFGGCKKFKRNWKRTLRWLIHKEFVLDDRLYKIIKD